MTQHEKQNKLTAAMCNQAREVGQSIRSLVIHNPYREGALTHKDSDQQDHLISVNFRQIVDKFERKVTDGRSLLFMLANYARPPADVTPLYKAIVMEEVDWKEAMWLILAFAACRPTRHVDDSEEQDAILA